MAQQQTTTLSRNWLLKTTVILIGVLGFGTWGVLDAAYFYPRRGGLDASFRLREYLDAAMKAGRLTPVAVRIADPRAELAQLTPRREQLQKDAQSQTLGGRQAKMDLARLEFLESMARMWRLGAEPIAVHDTDKPIGAGPSAPAGPEQKIYWESAKGEGFAIAAGSAVHAPLSPDAVLQELTQKWNTSAQPTPLSGYDMFVQWAIVVICSVIGLWLLIVILRAAAKKYRWDAESQRLTLPGGKTIGPSDIKEFDKRKWHKFFVTVVLNDGAAVKLDLLRYVPLEEWVLAMEKTAFPEAAKEEEARKAAQAAEENAEEAIPKN